MTNEELDKKFKQIESDLEEIQHINSKFEQITRIAEEKENKEE